MDYENRAGTFQVAENAVTDSHLPIQRRDSQCNSESHCRNDIAPTVGMEGRAEPRMAATKSLTVPPILIGEIRHNYRLAKSAESARIVIDQKLASFVRVYLTDWTPGAEPIERLKANNQALRVIDTVRKGAEPKPQDAELCEMVASMVVGMEPAREHFERARKEHRKEVERRVVRLNAWNRIRHINGFSAWGLGVLIGEAGDIGAYPGCRHLFKRLGLAPDACYESGVKKTGKKIPRAARGHVMGIIADPLLRAQWRGEKDDIPAHPIGPFGRVYGDTKARKLAEGFTKGHADKTARRAMVKALIHDVHHAWHGMKLDYALDVPLVARKPRII